MNVGSIINGGFRLIRESPAAVAAWAFLYLLANIAVGLATRPSTASRLGAARIGTASPAGGVTELLLTFSLFLILYVVLFAACQRAVLRPERRGFFYLRFGVDELRLLGLAVLFMILYLVASLVLLLIVTTLARLILIAGGIRAAFLLVLLPFLVMLLLGLSIEARFALAFPLTLMRRKIVIGESWRITSGRFWRLFGVFFILTLLMIVLWVLFTLTTSGSYLVAMFSSGFDPLATHRAQQAQLADQLGPVSWMMVLQWLLGAIVGTIGIVLFGGAAATAAKELTIDLHGIAETFA